MQNIIKIWGWDKKVRTMIRFIKPGNIFCFQDDEKYYFGRIVANTFVGDIAEVFDYTCSEPIINENIIMNANRLIDLVVLDSYSLFDRKVEGEWRIIGYQSNYQPENVENVYFTYGINGCELLDIYGNTLEVDIDEALKYPSLSPIGDWDVKKMIHDREL